MARSNTGAIARQTYYPFGTVRTASGTLPTDYTFTGQKLDASSNLLYYGARYYAADLGRFTQPDSLIPDPYNPQSLNRYSYVLNNPMRYTDPTGHEECETDMCDEAGEDDRSELISEIREYGVTVTGSFSKAELEEVKGVLDAYGDYIGNDRFVDLLASGIRFAHPGNDLLNIHRTRESVSVGWFDAQQAIMLPNSTFDPLPTYDYRNIVPDPSDIPGVLIGHEVGHIIRDGLLRSNGVNLTELYANQFGDGPMHRGAGPNENVATAIAMGALTQAGVVAGRDYTPGVRDFMASVALPYLRYGYIPQQRGAFP